MSKDYDENDIEDLFSDAEENSSSAPESGAFDLGEVFSDVTSEGEEYFAEPGPDEGYMSEAASSILKRSDSSRAYDRGEEYLDDEYFEEEAPRAPRRKQPKRDTYRPDDRDDSALLDRVNGKRGRKGGRPAGLKAIIIIAILAVLLIVVIVVAKCVNKGDAPDTQPGGQTETVPVESESETEEAISLVEEDTGSEVQALIETYLNARIANDMETLGTVVDNVSALPETDSTSAFFESYENITVYTVPGVAEGDLVAYVNSQVNLRDYDSQLPDLQFFYLRTGEDGHYYIATSHTEEEMAYMNQVIRSDSVQSLISQVWGTLDQLADSDEDLAALISVLYGTDVIETPESQTEPESLEESTETVPAEAGGMTQTNDTVEAMENVNIRRQPSTDAEVVGSFVGGDTATRTQVGENWSYITYGDISGYVMNDFITVSG